MKTKYWLYAVALFTAISLACTFNVQLPRARIATGPTVTEVIEVSPPTSGSAELTIDFGAGKLSLSPSSNPGLVTGTATYNVPTLRPIVELSGNQATIRQESLEFDGIPDFDDYTNEWDLQLGSTPLRLRINAGAYEGNFDLGGLALEDLQVMDGASSTRLTFNEPNQAVLESFVYETGASQVLLNKLGNANLTQLVFRGGAGDYTLDFSGALSRDAEITIDAGLSNVTISVPANTRASVEMTGGLSATTTSGSWRQAGGGYTLDGAGPTLTFQIEIGAGALELRTSE
jgi:hypothetical protein